MKRFIYIIAVITTYVLSSFVAKSNEQQNRINFITSESIFNQDDDKGIPIHYELFFEIDLETEDEISQQLSIISTSFLSDIDHSNYFYNISSHSRCFCISQHSIVLIFHSPLYIVVRQLLI